MRTIGVVTVSRSDYGIYRPVLRALDAAGLDVALFVGGAHLLEQVGKTIDEIENDGWTIAERVSFHDGNDTAGGIARTLGRGVGAFADALERSRPDLLLLLGDRYEMFAAGLAALPLALPLAHLHGGERTEGLIDEAIRHSLTKLSHLHFTATEEYARRVIQLGEEPWRVTVSGAPALDELAAFAPVSDEELARRGIVLDGATLLVTYHPLTLSHDRTLRELDEVIGAVEDSGFAAIVTYPGADTQYGSVIERLEQLAGRAENVTLVPSLGSGAYFTLLSRAVAMVGNSSSGIIEAASMKLPVVDVGTRQQGRLRGRNVIHVDGGRQQIAAAIARAASADFRQSLDDYVNPYGDGHAGERVAETLASVELGERLIVKRFHDLAC